ncbi:FAD binding domain-containing protein [Histoplasma ohiense]|nr:FAD binding domain-containing protein [Histoplasma ohiense (nom. inval.)]
MARPRRSFWTLCSGRVEWGIGWAAVSPCGCVRCGCGGGAAAQQTLARCILDGCNRKLRTHPRPHRCRTRHHNPMICFSMSASGVRARPRRTPSSRSIAQSNRR